MTFITSFEREARKEGRQEGEQKAKREIAQRLLVKGMSPEQVAEVSGLPLAEVIAHPVE